MIEYSIEVENIHTTDIKRMKNVAKKITFKVTGKLEGESFSLRKTITLPDPVKTDFSDFHTLTPEQVISWIESEQNELADAKFHIEINLNEILHHKKLEQKNLPWETNNQ